MANIYVGAAELSAIDGGHWPVHAQIEGGRAEGIQEWKATLEGEAPWQALLDSETELRLVTPQGSGAGFLRSTSAGSEVAELVGNGPFS